MNSMIFSKIENLRTSKCDKSSKIEDDITVFMTLRLRLFNHAKLVLLIFRLNFNLMQVTHLLIRSFFDTILVPAPQLQFIFVHFLNNKFQILFLKFTSNLKIVCKSQIFISKQRVKLLPCCPFFLITSLFKTLLSYFFFQNAFFTCFVRTYRDLECSCTSYILQSSKQKLAGCISRSYFSQTFVPSSTQKDPAHFFQMMSC